jgi:hypothetical protein
MPAIRRFGAMRDRSARPPAARPAAAAVPTIAGTFAFCAAVPTELPTFSAVEPTELPTPLSALVMPLADGFDAALRDLALRDGERLAVVARLAGVARLAVAEPDLLLELRLAVLRVPPDDLCVLRLEPRALDLRRVVACAIPAPFL